MSLDSTSGDAADRPNVVMVTVDSLRADHCGYMGYDEPTTPALDEFAENGLAFTNAIAPSTRTPQSMPALFTGTHPVNVDAEVGGMGGAAAEIRHHMETHESLAERFQRRGYETGAFTPNPWTSRHFGFDQGFDHFEDFLEEDRSSRLFDSMLDGSDSTAVVGLRLLFNWLQRESTFKPWEAMYEEIQAWEREADEPYFLWVFLLDPHFPYLPDGDRLSQSRWRTYEANLRLYLESQTTAYDDRVHEQLVTAYDDAIRYTDECFERIGTDLSGDPTIVVHGDHGEGFGEHGTYGHQDQLYNENVHVPLVVTNVASDTVEEPVSLRQLPEMLTSIADGGDPREATSPLVTARGSGIDRWTVRGEDLAYLDTGSEKLLYEPDDGEEIEIADESLLALCAGLASNSAESQRERQRIFESVQAAIDSNEI